MKAFGPPHANPGLPTCPVPVGEKCMWCEEVFVEGDKGFMLGYSGPPGDERDTAPFHRECHIRQIVGSVGHLQKRCHCHGGTAEDPEGMSKRQAALAAVNLYLILNPKTAFDVDDINPTSWYPVVLHG